MEWKKVKLEEVLEVNISGEWGREPIEGSETSVNIIRTTNFLNDGKIDLSNVVKREINLKKIEQKKLKYGDIIIEKSGGSPTQPVGRVVFFNILSDDIYLCNNFTSILRCDNKVFSKYILYYLLKAYKEKLVLNFQNKTTGIINLQLSRYVKELEVLLPPMDIQIKIANALDKAQELIDNKRLQLEKYDELLQSVFIDMFGDPVTNPMGWEIKKLEHLTNVGSSTRVFTKDLVSEGIPFYRGSEINKLSSGEKINSELYISLKHYETIKERYPLPQIGDLLMSSICSDGKIWHVDTEKKFYYKDGRVLWIKGNKKVISSKYLQYFLKNLFLINYDKIATGTTFSELKIVTLKELKIHLPPLSLQEQFALIVEKIENQKKLCEKSLNQMEDNFNSIMDKVFKGELF